MKQKTISIVVPCFNESQSLPIFYKELSAVFEKMNYNLEALFIDDGSKDNTVQIMKELSSKDKRVKYVSFSRNFGKEAAIYAGLEKSTGDYVAIMDADLQDPPSLLPEMAKILEDGDYSSVATRRSTRKGEPVIRSFFARMFYKIINKLSDCEMVDGARDYRLMKRQMVDVILSMPESNRYSKGIFSWVGFKTYWISYENIERVAGETKWNFFKLFKYAINGIIDFSSAPLKLASWVGFVLTTLSAVMIIIIIVRKLMFGDPVDGWASTMCVIIFIGGAQMMMMGVMGEYIGKIYTEDKRRPKYIVEETNIK